MLGPDPIKTQSQGYLDLALAQTPKPRTVAIVAADAEFAKKAADSARQNARSLGLDIVYDRSYPPTTVDYTPIVRAVQATNPEVTYVGVVEAARHDLPGPPLLLVEAQVEVEGAGRSRIDAGASAETARWPSRLGMGPARGLGGAADQPQRRRSPRPRRATIPLTG
jgi:branched-chain amino acid transport system substrate-binding protein